MTDTVAIALTNDEALVLFDWLPGAKGAVCRGRTDWSHDSAY
jgi:hypothetical protein